jgi:Xaa-Pro aminopeptidase
MTLVFHSGRDGSPMKKAFFRKRAAEVRERLDRAGVDTLWIIQPENRRYLSGFKAADGHLTESSGSLLITQTATLLVTDSRYTTEAEAESVGFEVITLKKALAEGLPGLLTGLGTRRLGFEEDHVTWGLHQKLANKLRKLSPPVRLVPTKGLVEELREVKDKEEVRAMEASSNLMSNILAEVFRTLKPGTTEKCIAWQIEGLVREGGADSLAFPSIVASGPNSALPHAVPTDRKIREREPVTFDVGVKLDGYCCDMTRTIFIHGPAPKLKRIYKTVRKAQLAGLAEIHPGVDSTGPDSAAREIIRQAGFGDYFGHSLGHGVGLATHERPRIGPENPVKLKEGMVVTVEPGIYVPRLGGVRLEEMVVIEKRGVRVLTRDDHFYAF